MFKYRNWMNYIFIDFFPCQAKKKKTYRPTHLLNGWVGEQQTYNCKHQISSPVKSFSLVPIFMVEEKSPFHGIKICCLKIKPEAHMSLYRSPGYWFYSWNVINRRQKITISGPITPTSVNIFSQKLVHM